MKAVKITNKLQDICHDGNAEKEVKILINNVYVNILNINIKRGCNRIGSRKSMNKWAKQN